MFILALDTCDARGGIALLRDGVLLQAEAHTVPEDYSSWLLPAITRVLTPAALTLGQIDLYAVAAGPGSFTGVRVGLTTVKAWSEVNARPIAAVSRLEAVGAESTGSAPYVAAFLDARRSQVYAALYRRQAITLERLDDEMVIAPPKFLDWCIARAGSEKIDWVSTDPECLTQTPEWTSRVGQAESVQGISSRLAPRIGQIGYRLAQQGRLTDALYLDANYIRRSDAELFWKAPPTTATDDKARTSVPLQIRTFHPSDAASISEIVRDSTEAAQWPSESYAKLAASPGGVFFVCETSGQLVGFLAARQVADEAEILNIAVHPSFRRKGVASALLLAALHKFRGSSVTRVFLELRESNQPARALYQRHGFVPSGLRKSYYRDPTEHALCMQKKLTAPSP